MFEVQAPEHCGTKKPAVLMVIGPEPDCDVEHFRAHCFNEEAEGLGICNGPEGGKCIEPFQLFLAPCPFFATHGKHPAKEHACKNSAQFSSCQGKGAGIEQFKTQVYVRRNAQSVDLVYPFRFVGLKLRSHWQGNRLGAPGYVHCHLYVPVLLPVSR